MEQDESGQDTDDTEPQAEVITLRPQESQGSISGFVKTHCMTCAAGWTRQITDGGAWVVCLLDREKVHYKLADCDRYEPRKETIERPRKQSQKI